MLTNGFYHTTMTFDPFLESTLSSTQDEDHHSRGISKRLRSSSLSGKDKRESFPTHSRSLTDAFECDYHPLRSTFNDAEGVTRPRLDRILLGSFEIIGNEQEDEDGCQMVEVQPPTPHDETVVFIHEVTFLVLREDDLSFYENVSDNAHGFFSRCRAQVWYQFGRTSKGESALGLRLHPSPQKPLHTRRQNIWYRREGPYRRVESYATANTRPSTI